MRTNKNIFFFLTTEQFTIYDCYMIGIIIKLQAKKEHYTNYFTLILCLYYYKIDAI